MSAVEERAVILTSERVEALNRARDVLAEITRDATSAAWQAPMGADGTRPQDYGRLAAVADVAGDLLFGVLNTARSYAGQQLTDDQVHNRKADQS